MLVSFFVALMGVGLVVCLACAVGWALIEIQQREDRRARNARLLIGQNRRHYDTETVVVNKELYQAFGKRELADDIEEETTTVWKRG